MKVTVSLPDATERRARRAAEHAHLNFSAFMAKAAEEFSEKVEAQSVTDQVDAALEAAGRDDSAAFVERASEATLRRSEW
jgi:hypothetical protein